MLETRPVTEVTEFSIKPGEGRLFADALAAAIPILRAQHGVRHVTFGPSVENAATYLLLVRWSTLSDHLTKFRESPDFEQFTGHFRPHLERPARVMHVLENPVSSQNEEAQFMWHVDPEEPPRQIPQRARFPIP